MVVKQLQLFGRQSIVSIIIIIVRKRRKTDTKPCGIVLSDCRKRKSVYTIIKLLIIVDE